MLDQTNVTLTLAIQDTDLDADQLDAFTRGLLRDMRDMEEVQQADLVATTETLKGSKALGGVLLGALAARFHALSLKSVFAFLTDRLGNKPIELEVEINGKKLKIKAGSRQELADAEALAEKFVASA